ncbi:hypothetical protein K32_48750 [Kaistia sp. 32K]|nr:hypothetical protein [Kaistia sp. 32K]BCP56258.1 hypothetical protein K32_48750 [Kaistia sp. 32K]
MSRKQREAKTASNGSKERFIELMGYDPELIGVPATWRECVSRFN